MHIKASPVSVFHSKTYLFQLFLHSFKISCVTVGYCMEQCLLTLIVFLLIDSLFATSLMVNFGCTGGQHRSVYCAQHLAEHLAEKYPDARVELWHREQGVRQTFN